MRLVIVLLIPLLLLAAPAPADAQQNHPPSPTARERGLPPYAGVGFLLRHRAELQLSDDQIRRLREISARLDEQNAPLVQQLREAGIPVHPARRGRVEQMTPAEKKALRKKLEEHSPTLHQLRENTVSAMAEARRVLTTEQQDRFRQLLEEEHRRRSEQQRSSAETGSDAG
jgi:Spy/CpxP family protein refolding chaperone